MTWHLDVGTVSTNRKGVRVETQGLTQHVPPVARIGGEGGVKSVCTGQGSIWILRPGGVFQRWSGPHRWIQMYVHRYK